MTEVPVAAARCAAVLLDCSPKKADDEVPVTEVAVAGAARCAAVLLGRERAKEKSCTKGTRADDKSGQRLSTRLVHLQRRSPPVAFVSRCESEWPSLPDVVLLNAAALLGPKEVSSLAVTCSSWAESITNSQAWLWSAVAACSVPSDVCRCLESWCCSKNLPLRQGLQLWLCRAHLWGAPEACFSSPVLVRDSWCGQSTVCCTSWSRHGAGGGTAPSVALGLSDGTLHFGALEPGEARGLRGPQPTNLRLDRSVRSAHGHSLVTAVQRLEPYGRAVTSGLDGLLRVWDPETAQEIHQIVTEHQRGLNSVAVSSEAEPRLLSCGDAGEVMIYSPTCLAGAAPLQSLPGHQAGAYCGSWLSASSCITGGFDRRCILWDLRSGKQRSVLPARQHVYSLISASEHELFVGLGEGCITQWDLRQTTPLRDLRGHDGAVEALALLPGALCSCAADGAMRIWCRNRGESTWHFSPREKGAALSCLSAVNEDTLLVCGSGFNPSVVSLDYDKAVLHVPKALRKMNLHSIRPLQHGGAGRHTDLRRRRRQGRAPLSGVEDEGFFPEERGVFDRSNKQKAVPLGSTGAAHRGFLCRLRR